MTYTRAVIGANYGDEGKGRTVDWLVRENSDAWIPSEARLVVRFNGGGQAGHTVVTPDGRSHIFKHIGSGAFAGAPTHLSKFFIMNPIIFMSEMQELNPKLDRSPDITADPNCLVTSPFEMALNQSREEARGGSKHGSCGAGIGDTVAAALSNFDVLRFRDLCDAFKIGDWSTVHKKLMVAENRVREFRKDNGLPELDYNLMNFEFSEAAVYLLSFIKPVRDARRLNSFPMVIFEGAQGLLLDQTYGSFPYVTRSNTGVRNVMALCHEADLPDPQFHYLTRAYLTRHGAGPMESENNWKFEDKTNVTNKFQDQLRFGPLSVPKLIDRIYADLNRNVQLTEKTEVHLHISHIDQVSEEEFYYVRNNDKKNTDLGTSIRNEIIDRKGWSRSKETWNFIFWRGPSHRDATRTYVGA